MGVERRRQFGPDPTAVREARSFVREALAERLDQTTGDDLALVLSELAANAVQHARTPFEVVIHSDGYVRIEVEDRSTTAPKPRTATDTEANGRGMQIIDQLCDRWGVHIVEDGKCVWCERDLPSASDPPQTQIAEDVGHDQT